MAFFDKHLLKTIYLHLGTPRDVRSAAEEEKELTRRGREVDEEDEDELPKKRGKSKKKVIGSILFYFTEQIYL